MKKPFISHFVLGAVLLTSTVSHAQLKLAPEHNQTTANFISQQFKTGQKYDLNKIQQFLLRLQQEKIALISDIYETKIIEKIELEVKNHKDAIKSAQKELDEKKSKYSLSYDQYLIPKVQELQRCVQAQAPIEKCDVIAGEFTTGYSAFYLPNAPRNIFHQDINYLAVARSVLGFNFKKNSDMVEAANLKVEAENLALTRKCIPEVKENDILTQDQIKRLKVCGVDISIYNPSDDSLWRKLSGEAYLKAIAPHYDWFPKEDDTIIFKEVKYSSAGSPKIEGEFVKDGKEIDIKIKMGFETHTEIVTSTLGKMLGMYQDTSIPRKLVKVYFKEKMTFDSFVAKWNRKYKGLNRELVSYLHSYGTDDKGSWIKLKDVQLSINDPKFLRVAPYEPTGWDLPNRREHRAQILWYGMVNMLDTKAGNHVLLFEKTPEGLKPRMSMQDVGYSLHFQYELDLSRTFEMLNNVLAWGVNTYTDSFLKWDENKVHVAWSDIMLNRQRFKTTTYSDVKWMARKIARLSKKDIEYAVKIAGFPAEVADLYIQKITARRNQVVKAFGLEKEYPMYEVPDLKTYSPSPKVKNGKITVSQFDGYASYELPRTSILSLALQGAASVANLKLLNDQLNIKVANRVSLGANIRDNDGISIKNLNIMPGINAEITRTVEANTQFVAKDGQAQAFVIKDRFSLEINVGSSIFANVKKLFPDNIVAGANVQAWKREFELVHFSDNLLQAYKKPFSLFNFIPDWKTCVVECLGRGEILKISDGYGVDISGKVPLATAGGIPVSVGAGVHWYNSKPTYFGKDQFSQFMIYQVESNMSGFSVTAGFDAGLDLMLLQLPILEFQHSTTYYNYRSGLYKFKPEPVNGQFDILTQNSNKEDLDLLNRFLDAGDSDPMVLSKKDMSIDATGVQNSQSLRFLLFWKKSKTNGHARSTVKTSDHKVKNFLYYNGEKGSQAGLDASLLILQKEATLLYKDNVRVSIEMDEENPADLTTWIDIWDYDRKMNRQELVGFIDKTNSLFSKASKEPFYKNYYLPPEAEVNKYRKIYGNTKVYIYGNDLIAGLTKMDRLTLTKLFKDHFKGNSNCGGTLTCKYERNLDVFLKTVDQLRAASTKDLSYMKLYHKLINAIEVDDNGISLIQAVLKGKNLFVQGEIYGVYQSFSTMNQDEWTAGRRFAARSWGEYQIPPLRKFLTKYNTRTESIFMDSSITFDMIFGTIPDASVDYY